MPTVATANRWLPPFINRLALKIAAPVALVGAVGMAVAPAWPLWSALAGGLGGGIAAYAAAHYWLHRRIRQTQDTLRQIRRHAFDDLTPPSSPGGDELSTLIWEVHRTGQTLENEIQDLKERENYRREFIGNVSHELKTPIFSVQGFTETLLDGALADETVNRTFLEKIRRNVSRLENLVRDLSAITKIETGELEMSQEAFDLKTVFQEVRESLELKAEEKSISLSIDVDEDLPAVYGDRGRIRRVIVNLVDNAIKYNEPGGTVTLCARAPSSDEVTVRIVDDGIGIPAEHLPRLTERFYRVDKSRSRNQGGTGLGLAIVKHILGAHNRDLQVKSRPGQGSTFGFTLPTSPQSTLHST